LWKTWLAQFEEHTVLLPIQKRKKSTLFSGFFVLKKGEI